ncbi:MAG TPA: alanine racemase [Pseudonocardiaceae bacterium]|nr:alanine racemase [Pseudonocardiaceae bacterium]
MAPPRAEVLIDLAAIRHNVELLVASAPGAKTMAVVKADAYGHGMLDVARTALSAGAAWLGVCTLDEALELREAGITAPVLSWLHAPDEDFGPAVAAGVDLSVSSCRALDAVLVAAGSAQRPARVHLKVDTGLSRGGAQPAAWLDLVEAAAKHEAKGAIEVVAVWSHLAHADAPEHPVLDVQRDRFEAAHQQAVGVGLRPLRHLANSAATVTRPDLHFDLVRPGIAVYGLSPVPPRGDFGLRPAMTFRSRAVLVKRVPAGEGVSYAHTWTTPVPSNLALVPVGYADGVPRLLSGRLQVLLGGRRRPVVGRVCMDQIVVDCGDDPVAEGDEVVLFGPGDRGEPTAQEWAEALGTIHYEIVTGMVRPRVVRTVVAG